MNMSVKRNRSFFSSRISLMALGVSVLTACGGGQGGMKMGDNEFAVQSVTVTSSSQTTQYPATIKGLQDIEIRPQVSGFIVKLCVDEGATVRKGQALFQIDPTQYKAAYDQAKAGVESAKANLKTVTETEANKKMLHEQKIISDFEYQTAVNNLLTAKANLAQAEAAYAAAKQNLGFCTVTSPSDGDGENRVVALDRANLEIVSSDFISIMGPSGSGKSTLLHLLSGLDKPSSGSLTYDGKDIYSYSDKELSAFRRKRIGFIFQQFNLLPVLTAKENIIMPLLLDKQKPDEAYLKQITELLGIQGRLEHLPHELSGGQQQRVAIARALIAKPDVIFADEPTGNLDSKSGGEVMELLQNVWKKMGKALVVITHDSRIARMADRQFQIVDGVLTEVTAK